MQGLRKDKTDMSLKSDSVWFKTRLVSQFFALSFLLTQPFYLPYLHAAPTGGEIVGGAGTISQSDLTTTINQTSQNMAIDWQSFDVQTDEKVNFVQPDSSSISLNRILGNNGSTIQGQINANGQVILVNPNGIFFTSTATINVGGLVASSLDISPSDFMNGNYIFNEVIGADGTVVNSGIINASLGDNLNAGGNVALIGKQVKNEGLISANLGSVVLAAGKQSILTFDNQGLLGVKVTKEVLQDEIGIEEAVINSGDIKASGGRVLLTASTSHDVFSEAVNTNQLEQAKSVVVHDDGTFTLGGGADVINTGSIDVSSESNSNNSARIILLGENITSSGSISADVQNGQAGEIELHAQNHTLLTENSVTSAQNFTGGKGGLIKVLGDKVGLFDQSQVNVSGAKGGGQVLFGGDRQGLNSSIRNASFIYLGEMTAINADAFTSGDGGKIITFATDTARIHGDLFARGGVINGNGGFIETSGLRGFEITSAPDVRAFNGNGGLWLIDPHNITIVNSADCGVTYTCTTLGEPFAPSTNDTYLDVGLVQTALGSGDVEVNTGTTGSQSGNISFLANLDINSAGNQTRTLSLIAANNISFDNGSSIFDSDRANGSLASLNITLEADTDITTTPNHDSSGSIIFNGTSINTYGGHITINEAVDITSQTNNSIITTEGGNFSVNQGWNYTNATTSFNSGLVSLNVGDGEIDLDGINGSVILGNITETGGGNNNFDIQNASSITQVAGSIISVLDNSRFGNFSTTSINLSESNNDFSSVKLVGASSTITDINAIELSGGTNLTTLLELTAGGDITDSGAISISNGTDAETIFNTTGSIEINGGNDNFDRVNFMNAVNVDVHDSQGGISISANSGADSGGITGGFILRVDNGDITDYGEVNAGSILSDVTFYVNDNRSIYLDNTSNTFDSYVINFLASSGTINNITLSDTTELNLQNLSIRGDLIVQADKLSFDQTRINTDGGSGLFSATTTNTLGLGTITQDSTDIRVYGTATTTLNATGDITLDDSSNDFQELTIVNGNIVSLRDSNSMSLLSSNTTGNITIQTGGDLSLVGDIFTNTGSTAAGNVEIIGNVLLATPIDGDTITINTNHATLTDGTVTFNNLVDNDVTTSSPIPRNNLEIISGDGDVSILSSIGSNANIGSLVINNGITSAATINLNSVYTRTYVEDVTNAIDITAGTINLNGNMETDRSASGYARGISLDGNVNLNADITLDTSDSLSDGNIIISGEVNGNRNLTITSESGLVDLQGALGSNNALSSLSINSAETQLGNVNLSSVTTHGSNDAINVKGTIIELNGDLNSNNNGAGDGGNITLTGDLLLNQSVSINSDSSTNTGSNGDVLITGDINSNTIAATRDLLISADNNTVEVTGDIGAAAGDSELQKVEIRTDGSANTAIDVASINTADFTSAPSDSGVILTAGTINLRGDILTNAAIGLGTEAGSVDINGQVTIENNITINANLAASINDGLVDFSDSIESSSNRQLLIEAGSADVNVTGSIGSNNNELSGFTVANAGTVNVSAIETEAGGISIRSNTINLYGALDTTVTGVAGAITLDATTAGNINLLTAGPDVTFNTNGVTSDANITLIGSVNNTVSKNLTLSAGNADVTMLGAAGNTTTALASLNIDGDNIELGQVTSNGDIIVNGASTIDLYGDLASNSGLINLQNGNVTLYDNVAATVTGANAISIDGTINSDVAANDHSFTANSGSGDIILAGNVGLTQAIQGLSLSTTGTVSVENIDTRSGGVIVSSGTLNLSGNISTIDDVSTAGVISLTQDNLNLNANVNLNSNSTSGADASISVLDSLPPTGMLGNNNSLTIDSGNRDVNITTNLTGLSSFTISSSGNTTLSGVETNDGLITVNANGNITLSALYDSGAADMVFSADVDANRSGVLFLNNTSQYSGNNITFSSYTFNADSISISAADTVEFSSTLGTIALGDAYPFAQTILSDSILDTITANTLQVRSDNSWVMLAGSNLSDNAYSLNLDANTIYFYGADVQVSNLNASASNRVYMYKNVYSVNDISITSPTIYSYNYDAGITELNSSSGNIDLTGDINTYRELNVNALAGTVTFNGVTDVVGANSLNVNANSILHDNLTAVNDINFVSESGYVQTSSLQSSTGNVSIVANTGNIALDYIWTDTGSITVNAVNGAIADNNGNSPGINIETAGVINLSAANGIGHNDPLEIISHGQNTVLNSSNTNSNNIEISNTGTITLGTVTNSVVGGEFSIQSNGTVFVDSVVLDKSNDLSIATFDVTSGDVLGVPGNTKHLTANTAIFNMNNTGTVGQVGASFITDVPNKIEVVSSLGTYIEYYGQVPPNTFIGDNDYKNRALQAIESLSGQQLIELESLAEIDPAIFTDVRNYSHSDIALMMPSDQRYDLSDDEEEDEEAIQKRNSLIHSQNL